MKSLCWFVLGVAFVAAGASAAIAEEITPSVEFTGDFYNKYIWRGQVLNDDPVFQPGMSVGLGNLTLGIWGNVDLTDYADRGGDFSEVDYYVDWSDTMPGLDVLSYSVGAVWYDFPGKGADGSVVPGTAEVYWGLGLDVPLSPSVTVYHDVDEAEGAIYANFAISHSFEDVVKLAPEVPVGIDLGMSYGWGNSDYSDYYWGVAEGESQDLVVSVAFPFEVGGVSVSPSVSYVTLVSDDLRAADTYASGSDYVLAGVSLSVGF